MHCVDLGESFQTHIFLQNLASIQKRTSPIKFDHLAEKSEKGSISNLSTKVVTPRGALYDYKQQILARVQLLEDFDHEDEDANVVEEPELGMNLILPALVELGDLVHEEKLYEVRHHEE